MTTQDVAHSSAVIEHKAIGEESLAPQETRIMDPWSYLFAWLGGCVSIGTFTIGSGLVGTLNLLQTFVAINHWLHGHRPRLDDQRARRT